MDATVFPPSFIGKLGVGKYTFWVKDLDLDSFETLLCAIAEFSTHIHRKSGSDHFPYRIPAEHTARELRMRDALRDLAAIHATGRLEKFEAAGWERELPIGRPFFPLRYREHLLRNPGTAWAHNLDERAVVLLFWLVGVFSIRCYTAPEFDLDPETAIPIRIALETIQRIWSGERTTPAELRLRLAKQIESSPED